MKENTQQLNIQYVIGMMTLSSVALAVCALFTKIIVTHLNIPVAIFLRCIVPLLIISPMLFRYGFTKFCNELTWMHLLRTVFVVLCQYTWFICMLKVSLVDATLLFMTSPLFTPLLMWLLFRKRVHSMILFGTLIGFVGVALIVQPSHTQHLGYALFGLMAGFFSACSQITLHRNTQKSSVTTNVGAMYLFGTTVAILPILLIPMSPAVWHPALHPIVITACFVIALCSMSNQFLRSRVFQFIKNPATVLPLNYLTIVFAGILGWEFLAEGVNKESIVGAMLVLASSVVISLFQENNATNTAAIKT